MVADLAVVVSRIDKPEPTVAHVQQHNAVVEAFVTEEVTPVPLRFGQWAAEPGVFDAVIREKADWYRERLESFAGALEFGIRVLRPEQTGRARDVREIQAASGAEYMEALRARVAAERGVREEVEGLRAAVAEVTGRLVREERVEDARTPHGVVTISHLVPRNRFDEYRECAPALRARFPELRFLVSGPWVPYSFAV